MGATGIQHIATRAIERLIIWFVAVGIAFFPALSAAHVNVTTDLRGMMSVVNQHGDFRELFFVVIVVAIIATSNLLDNIIRRPTPPAPLFRVAAWGALGYFLLLIVYQTFHFSSMTTGKVLDNVDFAQNVTTILVALCVTALTEILIAFSD